MELISLSFPHDDENTELIINAGTPKPCPSVPHMEFITGSNMDLLFVRGYSEEKIISQTGKFTKYSSF